MRSDGSSVVSPTMYRNTHHVITPQYDILQYCKQGETLQFFFNLILLYCVDS